jgi:Lamin Tail Domain
MTRRRVIRQAALAAALALAASAASLNPITVTEADAAGCVKITTGVFDSPSNDNYMPYLNQEYVVIKNACASAKTMTGWKVHDYNRIHTYRFPTGFKINPGVAVKLRSGTGTNGTLNLYWQRSYGAVWNNTPPEKAYLRKPDGTLASTWTSY